MFFIYKKSSKEILSFQRNELYNCIIDTFFDDPMLSEVGVFVALAPVEFFCEINLNLY